MGRRILAGLISILLALTLCGCWNYRGLDQMNIVVGIAIDFDKQSNLYKLSYEVADLMNAEKEGGVSGKIVKSEGKTLFEAARNAKRREADRLFFGSAHILIISQEVAREIGLLSIIEWFLRDGECRETMCVALSREDTAMTILESPDGMSGVMSSNIHDIITEDHKVSASSMNIQLYQVYNILRSERNSVMLPALHKIKDGDQEICEINGIAVFKEDGLTGFLTAEESKYALFVEDKLQGGILTLSMGGMRTDDISLEIFTNKTKKSFTYEKGKVKVMIQTDTDVAIAENASQMDVTDQAIVKKIQDAAQRMIQENIKDLVAKIQREHNADVFGFGEMIYKQDLELWRALAPFWAQLFPTLEVEVASTVKVVNSAFIR
ncbi:MAG: Ger(x)C family spore germination protein [Christensenellales bacterium]|jgi:spore germination protein KC